MKKKKISKSFPKTERKMRIQGKVTQTVALKVKRILKRSEPPKTWNSFLEACCISFLHEND